MAEKPLGYRIDFWGQFPPFSGTEAECRNHIASLFTEKIYFESEDTWIRCYSMELDGYVAEIERL